MVTNTFASVAALLLFVSCDVVNAFTMQPPVRIQYSHNHFTEFSKKNDACQQRVVSSNNFRPLHALSESTDLLIPSLLSLSFAAAAIYTFQHPETSDKIRDQFSSVVVDKPKETETSPVSPVPPAVKVQVPVTTISTQEELSSILKSVSDTVDKQSVVLDSLRVKQSEVKVETPSVPPVKRKFITRFLVKVIKPWKPWNQI